MREWELQMEQLNHAEERLCISALASSQPLLPAGPSLAITCRQLALLPTAELSLSHWNHLNTAPFSASGQMTERQTETNSAPALLA